MNLKAQNKLEFKSIGTDLKIYGYASVFNVKDQMGDVVLPGAFYHSLKHKPNVKLLWQHDAKMPIGLINKLTEDTNGLYIDATIYGENDTCNLVKRLVQEGVVDSLSIGYSIDEHFYNKDTRFLKYLTLYEVSIVTFPANSEAKLYSV